LKERKDNDTGEWWSDRCLGSLEVKTERKTSYEEPDVVTEEGKLLEKIRLEKIRQMELVILVGGCRKM
jgi:hypothetical protein